ncbi:unnamed protein product, partial [Medioppia subpectinata]
MLTIARTSATDETTDGNAEDTREVVPNDGHNNGDNEEEGDGEEENDGEGVPDIRSLLFGNEEEYDEDDDDEEEDNDTPEDSAVGSVASVGDIKRGIKSVVVSESEETASKRRSSESSDSTTNKRIKAEPIDQESDTQHISQTVVDSATITPPNPLTTTCEPIEVLDLPKDMKDFMTYLLGLSGNDLDSPDVSRISMYSQLKDISRTLQFKSMPTFLEAFIPFVVTDFWQKANLEFTARAKTRGSHRKCSVVDKWKTDRMHDGLEMKCISIIGTEDKPYFRFGQLVVIQTAFQPPPNSSQPTVSRRKYLGYVTNHSVRAINAEHQSEVNHLRYFCREDKRDYTLIEEISFMTRYSEEMYERNDWLMIAQPVICIHHYVLQMKAIFKFEQFPVWRQIFSPLFSSKPSGLLCQINDSKFSSKHRECIQIALDVVSNPSPAHSNFVLLKGSDKSYVLAEIVKQLVLCDGFGQSKVLVASNDTLGLRNLHQSLKRNTKRISDYFVTNNVSDLKDQTIKHIRHKLTKTLDEKKRSLYEQCLEYLHRDIHFEEM